MRTLVFRWIVSALVILALPHLMDGVEVESFGAALAAAAVLGFLNTLVRPLLILLTLPLTLITLGIFLLILNGLMFYWAGALVTGLHLASFGTAFLGSLLLSVANWIFELNFESRGGKRVIVMRQTQTGGDGRKTRDLK